MSTTFLGINQTVEVIESSFNHFKNVGPGGYTPLCLWGVQGIGKTSSAKAFVKKLKKEMPDKIIRLTILKLSAMQPFTINGYPYIKDIIINGNEVGTQHHAMPKFLADSYNVDYHVVFVDEINRARPEMHNAIMGMLDGDGINEHAIPENTFIIAAANPANENFGNVTDMEDAALLDRCIHINVSTKKEETMAYMLNNQEVDNRVHDFLLEDSKRIQEKNKFNSVTQTLDYSDRAQAQFGKFLAYVDNNKPMLLNAVAKGILGDTQGALIVSRLGQVEVLLTPEQILNKLTKKNKDTINLNVHGDAKKKIDARLDVVSKMNDTLVRFLNNEEREQLTQKQLGNLETYLDLIPHDLKENLVTKVRFTLEESKRFSGVTTEVLNELDSQDIDDTISQFR